MGRRQGFGREYHPLAIALGEERGGGGRGRGELGPQIQLGERGRGGKVLSSSPAPPSQVLARCRLLQKLLRHRLPPPLLRLSSDCLLFLLSLLPPPTLCCLARVCSALRLTSHDDSLWLPLANALPSKWAYEAEDRGGEPPWQFTLRGESWRRAGGSKEGALGREGGLLIRGGWEGVTTGGKVEWVVYIER